MINRPSNRPNSLHIWQQNSHKSKLAQQYILNTASPDDWDLIVIQEPWLDQFNNARGSAYWRVLYPSTHFLDNSPRTRTIMLINTNIDTDVYAQIEIPSADILAVKFLGPHGNLNVINIYNDCTHNNTIRDLTTSLPLLRLTPTDSMIWLGDFNRHHPIWESEDNKHLYSSNEDIEPLLEAIRDNDMEQALPPDTPTFETVTHNWTRPDNVWISFNAVNLIIFCDTDPSIRPIHADHLPIITLIDLPVPRAISKTLPDFHNYDTEKFNKALDAKLQAESPAILIQSEAEFFTKVDKLTTIIQDTIANHVRSQNAGGPRSSRPFIKRRTNLANLPTSTGE